jgi:hypothetical protein
LLRRAAAEEVLRQGRRRAEAVEYAKIDRNRGHSRLSDDDLRVRPVTRRNRCRCDGAQKHDRDKTAATAEAGMAAVRASRKAKDHQQNPIDCESARRAYPKRVVAATVT